MGVELTPEAREVLRKLEKLASVETPPHSLPDLRRAMRGWSKDRFDLAVIDLWLAKLATLSEHPNADSLPEYERSRLVRHWRRGNEVFFDRIALRGDDAERLLEALIGMESTNPPPNSIRAARKLVPGWSWQRFDAAALDLLKRGEVYMAPHDSPWSEDPASLVAGRYVSITVRHKPRVR